MSREFMEFTLLEQEPEWVLNLCRERHKRLEVDPQLKVGSGCAI